MQDQEAWNEHHFLGHFHGGGPTFPPPLWKVLGRDPPPFSVNDFRSEHYVPTGAKCGCVMFRQKSHTVTCDRNELGMYHCSVCEQLGDRNTHEKDMLEKVKDVVSCRKEEIIVCCQLPLPLVQASLRCDVVLVPCAALEPRDMIAIELDSTDHGHNPWQYGDIRENAYNKKVAHENRKGAAIEKSGMSFLRVSLSEIHQDALGESTE